MAKSNIVSLGKKSNISSKIDDVHFRCERKLLHAESLCDALKNLTSPETLNLNISSHTLEHMAETAQQLVNEAMEVLDEFCVIGQQAQEAANG